MKMDFLLYFERPFKYTAIILDIIYTLKGQLWRETRHKNNVIEIKLMTLTFLLRTA